MTDDQISELLHIAKSATQGEWHAGCYVDEGSRCKCRWILHEGMAGSIAKVSVSKAGDDSENPPPDEARANMRWIALASPFNIVALINRLKQAEDSTLEWEPARGIVPDATGDLSSEAFIRQHRDNWR